MGKEGGGGREEGRWRKIGGGVDQDWPQGGWTKIGRVDQGGEGWTKIGQVVDQDWMGWAKM